MPKNNGFLSLTLLLLHPLKSPISSFLRAQDPILNPTHFAYPPPPSKTTRKPRKKHFKPGEFPAFSDGRPRTPLKNIKKKLDRKEAAKAWVNSVVEELSLAIQSKQVFEMQPFYQPKEGTYMRLILLTAYCRSDLIHEAFGVLEQMKKLLQCQPDVFTYSTLMKACVDNLRFEMVEVLYDEMGARGISPNTVTQNVVLSGYGKAEMYDEMERVLRGMLESESSCKLDVWTMNVILTVFGSKGQIEMVSEAS